MVSHKPRDFEVRFILQGLQPPDYRISNVKLGTTVYERQQGVMRKIGWRMSYSISKLVMEFGEAVETDTIRVETVYINPAN
jgi:hypothetical protein